MCVLLERDQAGPIPRRTRCRTGEDSLECLLDLLMRILLYTQRPMCAQETNEGGANKGVKRKRQTNEVKARGEAWLSH